MSAFEGGVFGTARTGIPPYLGQCAVELDATKGHQVYCGDFYKPDVEYEEFFAHALIKPTAGGYFIADGDGGAHNLLFGVDGNTSDGFTLSGNMWAADGSGAVSFTTNEKMRGGEWAYVSVWYNKTWIILSINGVPSSVVAFNKNRKVGAGANGSGLSIGGTDHSDYGGRLAKLGIIEGDIPYSQSTALEHTIKPYTQDFTSLNHNLCLDFTNGNLDDISLGFGGEKFHGHFSEMSSGGAGRDVRARDKSRFPKFVVDPFEYSGTAAQKTAMVGARIYDDFSGQDQHKGITNAPTIGTTRVGSKTYTNGTAYGKQFGAAFPLAYGGSGTFITDNQSDGTIIWRRPTGSGAIPAGVGGAIFKFYFRYTDANNCNFLALDEYGSAYIKTYVGGAEIDSFSDSFSTSFTEAKVVLSGTSIKVYANGVLKHDVTSSANQTATGKGFEMNHPLLRLSEWGVI